MTSLARHLVTVSAVALSLAGCSREPATLPDVPSLHDALPQLEAAAFVWREDAYLEYVEIHIPGPPWLTSYASAVFRSPSEPHEMAYVVLEHQGTVSTRIVQTVGRPSAEEAITQNDFDLDTAEALELALDESGRRWLEENPESQCSFMQLRRTSHFPGHSVVWRLGLLPCPLGDPIQDVTIDAITGEVLEREYPLR